MSFNSRTRVQPNRLQQIAQILGRLSETRLFVAVEIAAVILTFLVLSQAEHGILELFGISAIRRRWILVSVYAAIFAIVIVRGLVMEITRLASGDVLLLSVVALAAVSTLWSPLPPDTFTAAVSLTLTVFFAAYLATRFEIRKVAWLLYASLIIVVATSALIVLIRPEVALHTTFPHSGKLRGLSAHKNLMAQIIVLGTVPGMLLTLDEFRRRRWRLILVASGQVMLVTVVWITDSRTAQVALVFSHIVMLSFLLLRNWVAKLADIAGVFIAAIGPIATGLLFSGSVIFDTGLLGRRGTLFARSDTWSAALSLLGNRLWIGNGFSSFWVDGSATQSAVSAEVAWSVYHAHNGYIDIVLGVGLIGLVLFFAHLIRSSVASARLAQRGRATMALMPIALIALIVMENTAESSLLAESSLYLAIYLTCSFWMNPQHGRYSQQSQQLHNLRPVARDASETDPVI